MKSKTISKKYAFIKESLFFKSFKLLKSNPSKTGLMILFDALFLVSLFGIKTLAEYYDKILGQPKTWQDILLKIIFSLVYYLILLFVYSFFKYSILDFIKSLFEKTEFSFKRLGQFYSLNIIIAGIFFAVMLIFGFILSGIKRNYQPFVFIFLAVPFVLFLYAIINISHSLFYEGASIKTTLKKSFGITFTKIKSYRETILVIIIFSLILWLLFFGVGYLIRFTLSKNYSLYVNVYGYFKLSSIIIFDIVVYLIGLINRISFYVIVKDDK